MMLGLTEKLARAATTSAELGWALVRALTPQELSKLSTQQEPLTEDFDEGLTEKGWSGRPSSDLHSPLARGRVVSSSSAPPPVPPFPFFSKCSPRAPASCSPRVEMHCPGE